MLEQLRLFLELRIDLFEFRLLRLQLGLGLSERASLLFELFVADAQLFLAGLQLLGLLLGLLQEIFEALAILGRAHRHRDRLRHSIQQFGLGLGDGAEKAQFHDGMHDPVDACRSYQQFTGVTVPHAGGYGQIARGHLAHADGAVILRRLAREPVAGTHHGRAAVRGNGMARKAPKRPRFGDVDRAHLRLQERSQKAEQIAAQFVERLVSLQSLAQSHLTQAQPRLELPRAVIA